MAAPMQNEPGSDDTTGLDARSRNPRTTSSSTAETKPYKTPGKRDNQVVTIPGPSQRASYTPDAAIDEHVYGRDGGKANAQKGSVPEVQVGGSFEVGQLPKMPGGNFSVGDDKNVSTPVTG